MRGPKSFQLAGEIADGTHTALNYSREAFEYVVENVKVGAERAGRDWRPLATGAWCVFVAGPDPAAAHETPLPADPPYLAPVAPVPRRPPRLHPAHPPPPHEGPGP